MDWRRISAVVSVSASLGVASFSAHMVLAADAITQESGPSVQSMTSRDAVGRNAPQQSSVEAERDRSGLVNGETPNTPTYLGLAAAKVDGWDAATHRSKPRNGCLYNTGDLKSKHMRPCVVFERGTPLLSRRDGAVEERGVRKFALVLGVTF